MRTFPLDGVAHKNFAANLFYLGKYDEAASEAREAQRLMPQLVGPGAYFDQMSAETYSSRLEEAKVEFSKAQARRFDDFRLHGLRHLIAFLQHDDPAMKQELTWLTNHNAAVKSLELEAAVQMYYGRFNDAHARLRAAEKLNMTKAYAADLRNFQMHVALQSAEVEDWTAVHRLEKAPGPFDQSRSVQLVTAMAAARAGDMEQAEKIDGAIDQQSPHDTLVQFYYLPTIRAAMELQRDNPAGAIQFLRPTTPYELANPDSFNNLYPAYIRGLAFLRLGQGLAASNEFQKLLDHPAIVGRYVTGALAHLQLGRAQAMMGDKAAARKSYMDFLTVWKDADSDIPIYKKAKAEYAALK